MGILFMNEANVYWRIFLRLNKESDLTSQAYFYFITYNVDNATI